MKRKVLSMLLIMVMVLSFTVVANAEEDVVTITIAHTNDTHARINEGKYDGMGFAKVYEMVNALFEEDENIMLLDAGDAFHGQPLATLVEGESIVEVMNAMGYTAMVPGNHDFNYGYERLLELEEMAEFPIISANVYKEDGTRLLEPYIIKEFDGVKVAIFGLSTPETYYKTHPANVEGLTFADPAEEAQKMVDELEGKADVIIALTHLGIDEESVDTSERVATEVDGIDIIIDGHSHSDLPEGMMVNGTLIAQANEYTKALGLVEFQVKDGEVIEKSASHYTKEEAAEKTGDAGITEVIAKVEADLAPITSVVVSETEVHLDGEREQVRAGETNLGNLITDAMLETTGADVALTNGGGIRASIPVGEITKGDIITVLPFGNYIVTKEVTGQDIWDAIENGIDSYPEAKGAFPHVAGMNVIFDANQEAGSRVTSIKIDGKDIDLEGKYVLATNNFMADGGDGYVMFGDYPILGEFEALDEALISYMNEHGTADAAVEGRIVTPMLYEVETQTYIVVPGDVLWKIAEKFGTTWEDLAEDNNLANPHMIFPGDELQVPAQ